MVPYISADVTYKVMFMFKSGTVAYYYVIAVYFEIRSYQCNYTFNTNNANNYKNIRDIATFLVILQ